MNACCRTQCRTWCSMRCRTRYCTRQTNIASIRCDLTSIRSSCPKWHAPCSLSLSVAGEIQIPVFQSCTGNADSSSLSRHSLPPKPQLNKALPSISECTTLMTMTPALPGMHVIHVMHVDRLLRPRGAPCAAQKTPSFAQEPSPNSVNNSL